MKNSLSKLLYSTAFLASFVPMVASAALVAVGPNSKANGFPSFYQDTNGLKLALCLEKNGKCGVLEGVNTRRPVKFPRNFPGEAFWWSAETEVDTTGGGSVLLVLALEAAFAKERVQAGQRVSFARVRIRGFNMPIGTYKITHPYGEKTFTVTSVERRNINFTNDVGLVRQNFKGALQGDIGPFLTWDPAVPPAAPAGFVGDPAVPHKVTGSPTGNNFLKIEKIEKGIATEVGFTDQFNVLGKITK